MGQLYLKSEMKFDLREYQLDCLKAIKTSISSGIFRILIAMATGLGKTVCFAHIPEYLDIKGRWLILAHREELLEQAAEKLRIINRKLHVAIEQAGRRAGDADIVVASVPTLQRKRLLSLNPDEFAGVICDESHHAIASTYTNIFNHFGLLDDGNSKPLLGFTATPKRGDGLGLHKIFQDIAYEYDIKRGIEEKYLSQLAGYRIKTTSSLDNINTRHGEFVQSQLENEINTKFRNQLIVEKYLGLAKERKALAFCAGVEHAHALSDEFISANVQSAAIDGKTPKKIRADILHRFSSGELRVVTNCGVLTEGFDDPGVSAIIMARPTKSTLLYTQIIGRGTRIADLKDDCLILDFADNSSRHSVCNLATLFGLPEKTNLNGRNVVKVREEYDIEQKEKRNKIELYDKNRKLGITLSKIDFFSNLDRENKANKISNFSWVLLPDSRYRLNLLNSQNEYIEIQKNEELKIWESRFHRNGKVAGSRCADTLNDAIKYSDRFVEKNYNHLKKFILKSAPWKDKPASEKQIKLLKELKIKIPKDGISRGKASEIIDGFMNRRK
jgi:superfamily II DNA or RNA helicase